MPRMIGSGLRNRAASINARSCVLSPISPSATTPADMRNASMGIEGGLGVLTERTPPVGHGDAAGGEGADAPAVAWRTGRIIPSAAGNHPDDAGPNAMATATHR